LLGIGEPEIAIAIESESQSEEEQSQGDDHHTLLLGLLGPPGAPVRQQRAIGFGEEFVEVKHAG
jgi:hypothetical protein